MQILYLRQNGSRLFQLKLNALSVWYEQLLEHLLNYLRALLLSLRSLALKLGPQRDFLHVYSGDLLRNLQKLRHTFFQAKHRLLRKL